METLIHASKAGSIRGEIAIVISDNLKAQGLQKAKTLGVDTCVVERKLFSSKADQEKKILRTLEEVVIDGICLAGFMHVLGKEFLDNYPLKILNIHPSLLPAFQGLDAVKKALDYGVKISGCTVHFVDYGVDTGPVIIQSAIPIHSGETVEALEKRILEKEHTVYPLALDWFCKGLLVVKNRHVYLSQDIALSSSIQNGFIVPSPL